MFVARKASELWKLRPVVTYRGCCVEANRGIQWAVVGSHLEGVGGQRFTVQVCSILEINVTLQHTHSFKTSMETVIMIWMMLTHSAHMHLLLHSSGMCHHVTHTHRFKTSMETVTIIWMMLTHSVHMCLQLHSSGKCYPVTHTHTQIQNIHGNSDHDLDDANSFSPHVFTAPFFR